ncbi:porin [Blattabacterium cuenoti]|nr:porin [Blattabacterium cuenoti]
MKKTKIIFLILFLGFFYPFHSFSEIIKQKKTTEENPHLNVFLDYSSSIDSSIEKETYRGTNFCESNLKLDVMGKVNDKISYHFAKQLLKEKEDDEWGFLKSEENSKSIIDLAYLKYKWNDKLYFLFGKQPFAFGSMEFNPACGEHIYRYPYVQKSNKESSIGFSFIFIPKKDHELQFQVVNGMNKKEDNVNREINHPIGYSLNWNWNLNNDDDDQIMKNRWSYSIFQENEKRRFWKLLALGSQINCNPVSIEANYIFSDEDLEKNGDLTKILRILNRNYYYYPSVTYGTYSVKLKYNFIPKWNLIAKGAYEIGTSKKGGFNDILEENKLFKKAYVYYGGIEFSPIIKNEDLSFYLAYQNQRINYNLDKIKKENRNDHLIILGLSYRIKII